MFLTTRVIVLHHNSRIWDRPTRDCCTLSQRQNGYSVVPEHPHVGPHGPNRASFFMNPMYSIARTRQCPRKSCSPRQPMAAYMWNGLQPVTSFTLIPNPNPFFIYTRPSLAQSLERSRLSWDPWTVAGSKPRGCRIRSSPIHRKGAPPL